MVSSKSLKSLDRLVALVSEASPQQNSELAVIMRTVSGAYPGHAKESWVTLGRMRKAVDNGTIADYSAARTADPDGRLAKIVGIIYAHHPVRNQEKLARFMAWESSYTAEHTERLGNGM